MHLFFGTSTHSPWTAENLFFGSIWLSFLEVNLSVANTYFRPCTVVAGKICAAAKNAVKSGSR